MFIELIFFPFQGGQTGIGRGKISTDVYIRMSLSLVSSQVTFSFAKFCSLIKRMCVFSEITTQLLVHGIRKIFILGRSKEKFSEALKFWRSRRHTIEYDEKSRLSFVQCDLADIRSVKDSADQIMKATDRLDIVICNAGSTDRLRKLPSESGRIPRVIVMMMMLIN